MATLSSTFATSTYELTISPPVPTHLSSPFVDLELNTNNLELSPTTPPKKQSSSPQLPIPACTSSFDYRQRMERFEIQLRTERGGVELRVYSSLGIDWPCWTRLLNRSRSGISTTRSPRRSSAQFKPSISSLEEPRVCYFRLSTRLSSSTFNNKRSLLNSLLPSSSTSSGAMMEIW